MSSVLITGASRGLGLEFARQYAADGWQVFATCRHPSAASALDAVARTGSVKTVALDVTSQKSIEEASRRIEQPIDLLINCAGIAGKPDQKMGNADYKNWLEVFDVNTIGPLRVTEAFINQLARGDRKLVVTITSGMGSIGDNNSGGSIAYRSSKAAVNMVMRSAAIDLKPRGIIAVVINPGWVETDMGGADAPLTAAQSVGAMKHLIGSLGPAQSGKFFNYDGREYPW
jgi:NAD(P)-dependent dehydrogenase (short-subunit alcohol dehydrogenase family)